MKRLIYSVFVILITYTFANCSNSSDDETFSIIGVWNYSQRINNGIDVLSHCERNGTTTFNADKTFKAKYFTLNNSDCVHNDSSNGTWNKLSETEYTIVGKQVTISFSSTNTIIVRENGADDHEIWVRD